MIRALPSKQAFFLIEFSGRIVSEWTAHWQDQIIKCKANEDVAGLQDVSEVLQIEIDQIGHALSSFPSPPELDEYLDQEDNCLWYLSSEEPGFRPKAWYDVDDDDRSSKAQLVTAETNSGEKKRVESHVAPVRFPAKSETIGKYVENVLARASLCRTSALELKRSLDLIIKEIVEQPNNVLHTLNNGRRISPRALANALEPYVTKAFLRMQAIDVALVLLGGTGELFVSADVKKKAARILVPMKRALSLRLSDVANIVVVSSSGDERWRWKDGGRDTFEHAFGPDSGVQEAMKAQEELIDSINMAMVD